MLVNTKTNHVNNNEDYYRLSRPEICQFLPNHYSKILEIGCGEGDFRTNLSLPCEYWGVEPVSSAAENALSKLDKVLKGTYEENLSSLPDHYFDLVICNDVIEHMVDHNYFFQSIQGKLTKNACIIGSIPNVRYIKNLIEVLFEKEWRYKESGILDNTHLRFFTEKSLKRSIIENNFEIDKFSGLNNHLKNCLSIDGIYRRLKYFPMLLILGQDIKYLQFGMRIKPKNQ